MIQQVILFAFLLSITLLQVDYPKPETLQPLTPDNIAKIQPLAAIGSDTLDNVLWSPDGKVLATVTSGQVLLYKVDDLKSVFRTIPHDVDEQVSFEADGHLKVGSTIWNIPNGTSETNPLGFFQRSPSGRLEVTSTDDGTQTIVTISDSRQAKSIQLKTGNPGKLDQIVFSPDEKFAVLKLAATPNHVYGSDAAQLWNVELGTMVAPLDQALEYIGLIAFHANGQLIVTTSATDDAYGGPFEEVRIWDGHTGVRVSRDSTSVLPVRFSPNDQFMVYGSGGGISLWSDHEIGWLQYDTPYADGPSFSKPLFSPDGKNILAIYGSQIMVWDTNTAFQLGQPRFLLDNKNDIWDFSFSEDGKRLIVVIDERGKNKVRIWDFTKPTPTVIQVINDITSAEISPDLKWIWARSFSNSTSNRMLIDATTGERLLTFPGNAQLDPQWKYIAYRSANSVNIIDLNGNKSTVINPLPNYLGTVDYFDDKRNQVIFASFDSNISTNVLQAYDLTTGKIVFSFKDYSSPEQILSRDDRFLLSLEKNTSMTANVRQTDRPDTILFQLTIQNEDAKFFLLPKQQKLGYIDPYIGVSGGRGVNSAYSRLELWNISNNPQSTAWTVSGDVKIYGLNTAENLLVMATGDSPSAINLLELDQPQAEVRSFELPTYNSPVYDRILFSPNDQYLAVSVDDQSFGDGIGHEYSVFLYKTQQFNERNSGDKVEPFTISSLTSPLFSPDSQFLLCYEPDDSYEYASPHKFHLWGLKDKVELSAFAGDGIAAFNPDSSLVAVHNQSQTDVYSLTDLSGSQVKPLVTIPDNEGQVKNLAFSVDGKRLYLVEEARVRVYGVQ